VNFVQLFIGQKNNVQTLIQRDRTYDVGLMQAIAIQLYLKIKFIERQLKPLLN